MKRVGIITFHESNSLGANLQAYALQTSIEKLGYDVQIINYDRKGETVETKKYKTSVKELAINIANDVSKIINKRNVLETTREIIAFRNKYLKIAEKRYSNYHALREDPPAYDYYVTGSDQVWNPYTGPKDAYYLGFVNDKSKNVAYAPSIGVKEVDERYHSLLKDYLEGYRALSCRERVGAEVLQNIVEKTVKTVLDPTLLISPAEWIAMEDNTKTPTKPYLLCYFLGSLSSSRKTAEEIAQKKGLQLIDIPGSPVDSFWKVKKVNGVGPRQFISLIHNAAYICTDSFHGTAFSINFGKPFLSFQRRGYDSPKSFGSRLENILEIVKLEKCLVKEGAIIVEEDYAQNNMEGALSYLIRAIEESKQYLQNALMEN